MTLGGMLKHLARVERTARLTERWDGQARTIDHDWDNHSL
jgi:hypothetical protein